MEKIPEHIEKLIRTYHNAATNAGWYIGAVDCGRNELKEIKAQALLELDNAEADLRRAIAAYIEAVREP